MAIIRLMREEEAAGKVKEVFEDIKNTLGIPFVPTLFLALGQKPDQLGAVWAQIKGLFGTGTLDVKTKTLAALAVAAALHSAYFITIHAAALKRLGSTDQEIGEILEVASLTTGLNTLVSGLGLEPEL